MKLKKFQEEYNCAPYELHEYAEGALKVTDCEELRLAAQVFLEAKARFEASLANFDVEMG